MCTREGVLAPNVLAKLEVDLRLRIAPVLGHVAVDQITRHQVEQFVADLLRTNASVRMVRRVVSTPRRLLEPALEWGRTQTTRLDGCGFRHLRPVPARLTNGSSRCQIFPCLCAAARGPYVPRL
jgi:hypothetical protein